jgi:hypothetical protein
VAGKTLPSLNTPFVQLWCDGTEGRLVHLVRSEKTYDTLEEIDAVWGSVARALRGLDRGRCVLLVDFRRAKGRNDDAFEKASGAHRAATSRGFRRVAVLVKTLPGQLQVQRLARQDGVAELRCFDQEEVALSWLEEALESLPRGD